MKKYLLIGALAIAGMAFAKNNVDLSQVKKTVSFDRPERVSSRGSFDWQDLKTLQERRKSQCAKAEDEDYDAIDWFDAVGAFHMGVKEGFSFYPTYGIFQVPLLSAVEFWNLWGATDWTVNGQVAAEGTDTYEMSLYSGPFYGPSTADHELIIDEDTLKIKGATYGTSATFVFSALPYHDTWWDETGSENPMMTKCGMTCDAGYGTSSGRDLFCVDGGETGDPYLDGCGVHLDPDDPTKTADTLGVLVDNIGIMRIDKIVIPIWNKSEEVTSISEYIPDDAEIRLALFPMDEEGAIYFDDTIASTVITNKDFVAGVSGVDYGTLTAKFYEEDLFGEIVEVPVYVKGSFYLQLTNFNESGCDFGIYEDLACPVTGTTVYQNDGLFSNRASEGMGGEFGQNLAISFDAYFPGLLNENEENELNATAEEGYAYFGGNTEDIGIWLLSNINYEEWEVETSEEDSWLGVVIANSDYWEDYGELAVAITVEALPEGIDSRDGQITIIADGAEQVFTVHQSVDAPQAIENVNFKNNGKNYDVLGREVNEGAKGVIIRNGKKILR